jgi:hypothetical protein
MVFTPTPHVYKVFGSIHMRISSWIYLLVITSCKFRFGEAQTHMKWFPHPFHTSLKCLGAFICCWTVAVYIFLPLPSPTLVLAQFSRNDKYLGGHMWGITSILIDTMLHVALVEASDLLGMVKLLTTQIYVGCLTISTCCWTSTWPISVQLGQSYNGQMLPSFWHRSWNECWASKDSLMLPQSWYAISDLRVTSSPYYLFWLDWGCFSKCYLHQKELYLKLPLHLHFHFFQSQCWPLLSWLLGKTFSWSS